jgi:hypothetical protein
MIANGLNVLLGLWLIYIAVLDPAFVEKAPWRLAAMAVVVIVLAVAARPGDTLKWVSTTNVVVGVVMLVLAALRYAAAAPDLLMFWGVFWAGTLVAVLALWAALYRPRAAVQPQA